MRPLSKSITIVGAVFFAFLSIVVSVATYNIFTSTMFGRYQKQMASVLNYVESHIDHDDMAQCAATYVESDKYKEFQAFFDDLIDHYEDVHYLYIMQVLDTDDPVKIREICAANSTYEKENEPDMVLHLGDGEEGWFDAETTEKLREILKGNEDVYFMQPSAWGVDYTLARPLVNSAGQHYGILCADVSVDELNTVVYRNIYIIIGVIFVCGSFFIVSLLYWLNVSVVRPIKLLEKSVTDYAEASTGKRNPDELHFDPPVLRVRNEVSSLSEAVSRLSSNMTDYVKSMLAAEDETKDLQAHVSHMNSIAYKDALTKVKNQAAYDKEVASLSHDIALGRAEFGIVMVDLNNLKMINDRYGHEHGNDYILGSCRIICRVFSHSPVFRIGGDEFAVVIRDHDYKERGSLYSRLIKQFADSFAKDGAAPWQCYSAACGMAIYQKGDTVESVFNRADRIMYENKASLKAGRAD